MTQTVLTPCPTCGKRFDVPLTGCMTGVLESLLQNSNGNCPKCGTCVVVDQPPEQRLPRDPFTLAETIAETRSIPVVNLQLSVRCRLALNKMNLETVGDLLDLGRAAVIEQLGASSTCAEDLLNLFADKNVPW